MTVHRLLARQARLQARGRAARFAGRIALLGAVGTAVLLLAERLGLDLPWFWMPDAIETPGALARLLGFLAISLAGLVQGSALLAAVFLIAWLVRTVGPVLLRRGPHRVARDLDGVLVTDRFSAALEAQGPLQPLAQALAPPPGDALVPPSPGRLSRSLTCTAAILVLLIALMPGSAGGEPGVAPAPGDEARSDTALALKLIGEARAFPAGEPVLVHVLAEARAAPERDLKPEVLLEIDGTGPRPTGQRLFIPAGAVGPALEDSVDLNLLVFTRGLEPGEHVAVAHAGDARSNPYRFRIEAPSSSDPKNKPNNRPQDKPKQKPPRGQDDAGRQPKPEPKFVQPLVRDGEKVRKRARVPIEVPGAAPQEKTLKEAWPTLEKRREAALNHPGLSPIARKLVREYFERLRPAK